MYQQFWQDRRVFVTGHTGFKGGWLTMWLHHLGAKVYGYSTSPPTEPNLFTIAGIKSMLAESTIADLADLDCLKSAIKRAEPDVLFHLAAQPLVRESYKNPLNTFSTNIMGTANVLEATRSQASIQAALMITTDKVYENREWLHPYREPDPLGGKDPYSASKAAAEIIVASYRDSFFGKDGHQANIATTRAGNVIGGGDWAADRLVPDCLRSFDSGEPVHLRYPTAVRPWQHVLEPLSGYLRLATEMAGTEGEIYANAWNFGPDETGNATVAEVADTIKQFWGGNAQVDYNPSTVNPHEAGLLRLDSSRARTLLNWTPNWSVQQALKRTVDWYKAWRSGEDMAAYSYEQINEYITTRN